MNFEIWLSFLTTTFLISIIPGPSMLLGLNRGFIYGKRKSIATAMGMASASALMGLISLLSLGAVITTSGLAFQIIKYLGALYLVYLGIKSWRALTTTISENSNTRISMSTSVIKLYIEAFLAGLSNPKAIIFFTAMFPQFLDPELPQLSQFFVLLLTQGLVVFLCMMIYITGGQSLTPLLKQVEIVKWVNKVTGGVFVGFGIGVAWLK